MNICYMINAIISYDKNLSYLIHVFPFSTARQYGVWYNKKENYDNCSVSAWVSKEIYNAGVDYWKNQIARCPT